jgi:hypothetical protein
MFFLEPENEEQWKALEKKVYEDIKLHAVPLEMNKKWTKENRADKGIAGVEEKCRTLA